MSKYCKDKITGLSWGNSLWAVFRVHQFQKKKSNSGSAGSKHAFFGVFMFAGLPPEGFVVAQSQQGVSGVCQKALQLQHIMMQYCTRVLVLCSRAREFD